MNRIAYLFVAVVLSFTLKAQNDSSATKTYLPKIVVKSEGISTDVRIRRLDGSTISPSEISETVTRLMKEANVTGMGISIFNDGQVVYSKTFGVRDKDNDLPLTENTIISAASFTKVVFAYLVMQLVEERILNLDKPVYEYLPIPFTEYDAYKDLKDDPRYKKITARMLLSHTSGLPNIRQFEKDQKLNIYFEPGSRFAYSGEGIMLLQLVVESITKKSIQDLMQDHILQPFGMTRTSLIWENRFDDNYSFPYNEDGRSLGPPEKRSPAMAAGSMLTTLHDFTSFIYAVINNIGLKKKTRDIMLSKQIKIFSKSQFPTLSAETTEKNLPINLSYGLGWGLYWTPYGKAFFKEGHSEGWRNYTVCFDDQKTGIIIMTNSSNGEGIYKELLESLLRNTFTPIQWEGFTPYNELPPRKPPKEHKEVTIDYQLLDQYIGRYSVPPSVLTISKEGNHLSVKQDEEPDKIDIFPESDKDFFAKIMDIWMTFDTDKQGKVSAIILHSGGTDIRAKRIE
jgi:CubicO group peptidase (beta-lactamase class C family)